MPSSYMIMVRMVKGRHSLRSHIDVGTSITEVASKTDSQPRH